MSVPTIFITGITGCQGSAVARRALELGWIVRAVSRDPSTAAAAALSSLGAKIKRGDWADEAALARGLDGCDCLFLNLIPSINDLGAEERQSMIILRLAKAAGVQHTVYSGWPHRPALMPSGELSEALQALEGQRLWSTIAKGKGAIDDAVRTNVFGFARWTILRAGFFMVNMLAPKCFTYGDFATTGTWTTPIRPTDRLPMMDHEDLARFAVAAFEAPAAYHGREVPVASALLTPAEVMAAVSAATGGKTLRVRHLEHDDEILQAARQNPFLVAMLSVRNVGVGIDLDAIKSCGVPMTTFEEFLRRERQGVEETYAGL